MDPEGSSSLPWLWVIEALTEFRGITITTLQALIGAAPVGLADFPENIRELVALRCLEELCSSADGVNNLDASSSLGSRVRFDFSRSCEDVLQEIVREMPPSKLKMAGTKLFKWDVSSFIVHKRAGISKCHLEQLKESILEGSQPHTDYFKDRSGLFRRSSGYTVNAIDGQCDEHSEKVHGKSSNAEKVGPKENSVLESGNKSSKEHLLDHDILQSKRDFVFSADEHIMGHLHEKQVCINECEESLRKTKRIKCASTSFEYNKDKPVSHFRNEVSKTSIEKILLISENGGHQTEKYDKEALGDGSLEDDHHRCTASNSCQPNSHNNEVFHDESNIPFNTTLMPQHAIGGEIPQQQQVESIQTNVTLSDGMQHKISGGKPCSNNQTGLQPEDQNGSQQTLLSDKAPKDTGNGFRVGTSGDTLMDQGENINLLMKKHEEQNLGMKCNGGQLLIGSDANVPSVVHESHLGMTTTTMPLHTFAAEPCQNKSTDETDDIVDQVEPISTNDDNADKIQHIINEPQPKQKEPNVSSLNVSRKPIAGDKIVVDTIVAGGAELSSDSAWIHNEKIDLAAKKHELLSSRGMFSQDFSAMAESSEQNLCKMCNQGGQLLVCKTTACSFVVHENCLGASAQLDANGNFFCPFCAYSHTISEYLEAKKKASLARGELSIFISKSRRKEAAECVREFHRQEHCLSRQSSKCEHIQVKNNQKDQLKGPEDDREDCVGEHANEANVQLKRSHQQAPVSSVHLLCREKEKINNGFVAGLRREEERDEMPNEKSLTGGRVDEKQLPTDHVDGHGGDKLTCKNTNTVSANQSNAGVEVPQEMTKPHNMYGTLEQVLVHDTRKEEASEDKCEKHNISDSRRLSLRERKQEAQCKPQASPKIRRKKIPWTAEEEELIREGVQKFCSDDQKIPWKKILAFGSHVFSKDGKHRMPQDLKDKWKNMCKSHRKSK